MLMKAIQNNSSPRKNQVPHCRTNGDTLRKRRARDLLLMRRARYVQLVADMDAPRLWAEILNEIDDGANIDLVLEKYAGIDIRLIRILGADQIPAAPLHVVMTVGNRRVPELLPS